MERGGASKREREKEREREIERERARMISPVLKSSCTRHPPLGQKHYKDILLLYSKRFFSHNVLICLSKLLGQRR